MQDRGVEAGEGQQAGWAATHPPIPPPLPSHLSFVTTRATARISSSTSPVIFTMRSVRPAPTGSRRVSAGRAQAPPHRTTQRRRCTGRATSVLVQYTCRRTWQRGRRRDVEHGVRVFVEGADGGAALADEGAAQARVHQHAQLDGLAVLGLHGTQCARLRLELGQHEVQRGQQLVDGARDEQDAVLALGAAGIELAGAGKLRRSEESQREW